MAYLYLNFLDNLEVGLGDKKWGKDDFYTTSLNEQYEVIKRKLGSNQIESFQEFITYAFPTEASKNYYISLPSFDRRIKTEYDKNGREYKRIRNIVIRPAKDRFLNNILPEKYDLIVIGDVTFGKIIDISVKGIELIDTNVAKYGERLVNCTAANAFGKTTINMNNGTSLTVIDYGTREMHDAVLTNDFVDYICKEFYPIPNAQEAIFTFKEWQKYINFRKYYLGKQSERCERISNVTICNSYMVTKENYRRNEEMFEPLLLDGLDKFKGEQTILSKEVTGSDSFPLIRVDIEKNRKELLMDLSGKNGKGKPKYESHLQRYTNESMGLSSTEPRYDENGNIPKGVKFAQYLLGERYLFAFVDVEPDCSSIDKKYDKLLKQSYEDVDNKYNGIIKRDLLKYIEVEDNCLNDKYNGVLLAYQKDLDSKLDEEVTNNKDKEIKKEIEEEVKRLSTPFREEYNKKDANVRQQMKELEKSKLSKSEKEDKHEELRSQIEWGSHILYQKIDEVKNNIDVRGYYIARNKKLIENKKKSLIIEKQVTLDKLKKEKEKQLLVQYKPLIDNEKFDIKGKLDIELEKERQEKIENETIRRYQIYFRPNDINDKVKEIEKEIESLETNYLTYDNRAEKKKIERQEKALNSFMGGYVKNPFLASYLFAPKTLSETRRDVMVEPDWCLESLNERQKTAVKRALASESIFLLQGPPGTGKTQVIAEITAQYAKQGKKVLISSETHKAIDNVFERLPKIPEIRPLRLIPSTNGKETNYSPERLVDNFYINISGNLEKQVKRFEHFEETKADFDSKMKGLRFEYEKVLRLKKENKKIDDERNNILLEINKLNNQLEEIRSNYNELKLEIDLFNRTEKHIESFKFETEGVKENYILEFQSNLNKLLIFFSCFENFRIDKISKLINTDIEVFREELTHILSEDTIVALKDRQQQLRNKMADLRNPETDEAPVEGEPNYEEYKKYQTELIDVAKNVKLAQEGSSFDYSESLVFELFGSIVNNKELLKVLLDEIKTFKIKVKDLINSSKEQVEKEKYTLLLKLNEDEDELNDVQSSINSNKIRYEELGENSGVEEYSELNSKLKQQITRFFRDFDIVKEYDSENLETAFKIISEEWDKMEYDYKSQETENKTKIPMYKEICKYLNSDDILEDDREAYTRELYNCVNVFGITCTSRDRFDKSQLLELDKYGIESVDIRTQGIDVVIIDEVSKSSFLDLLIPILYGKTVILVGDHRQLPPMYDLRHMRENDFEGLDESIISKGINTEFTNLYEECFFKTLYEKVPEDFRVMLNKQYRCHSHIMEVFNHFYGGNKDGLQVGKAQQDDEKEHGLFVKIKNNTVIDPKHHIYFVDCDEYESSAYEGSTSKVNEQEASVAITLLKEFDKASNELVKSNKIIVDANKKIDERPSVGVICTYGDQAGLIKKKRKYQQFTGFSGKQDEKLIISTVDDFQGDERDIIVVSMVRNPAPGKKYDAEFIKKFERINVALSRARKLLVIVGSKKFLTEAGIIDLPDLAGNHALDKINFHVYKEIIDTIEFRGRMLNANDILGE